jgi:hypothetical protein
VVVDPVDVDTVLDVLVSVVEIDCGAVLSVVAVGDVPDSEAVELEGAEPDSDSEDASDGGVSATARPAPLTIATPIPSATANAPTRPTYAAALI